MSFKIYDFAEARLTKSYLKSLPKQHLNFIVNSSLAANDLSIFVKLMIGYDYSELNHLRLTQIASVHQWAISRVFSAKMIEFANVFENYAKVLKRKKFLSDPEHASTLEKTIEQLKASEEYEFARSLRNSATNHYLQDDCASNIDRYKDNHRFIMLWSDQPGNCYFPFAEEIAHLSHFSDDPEVGKDLIKAQRWLHKLATDLINLHHQSLNCILQKYPTEDYGKTTVFVDKELVATPDDRLPILFFNGTGSRF